MMLAIEKGIVKKIKKIALYRISITPNGQGLPKCRPPLPSGLDKDIEPPNDIQAGYMFYRRHFGKPMLAAYAHPSLRQLVVANC
jgi:hypothetical protein